MSSEKEKVSELGHEIGFGNMMHLATKCWEEYLTEIGLSGGAFITGPCKSEVVPCICVDIDQGHCKFCCGCGWLTKEVRKILDEK